MGRTAPTRDWGVRDSEPQDESTPVLLRIVKSRGRTVPGGARRPGKKLLGPRRMQWDWDRWSRDWNETGLVGTPW